MRLVLERTPNHRHPGSDQRLRCGEWVAMMSFPCCWPSIFDMEVSGGMMKRLTLFLRVAHEVFSSCHWNPWLSNEDEKQMKFFRTWTGEGE